MFSLLGYVQTEAIDVDIDEILDMDTDDIRRSHLIVRWNGSCTILPEIDKYMNY